MRRGCILLALALILSLLPGCAGRAPEGEGYRLYFLTDSQTVHGSALGTEPYTGGQTADGESAPTPGELIQALLSGPATEGLTSPFPRGVTYQWWDWDEEKPGILRVGLSEQYGGLTDISLTLADYCIVLTLSQLEGVEGVEILSGGRMTYYRSHQILQAEEAVLTEPKVEEMDET